MSSCVELSYAAMYKARDVQRAKVRRQRATSVRVLTFYGRTNAER